MAERLNIAREVAALKWMTVKELRGRYAEVFVETTRSGNKDWLWKRIGWRMQANAKGGLEERARRIRGRAEEIAIDANLRLGRLPDCSTSSPATMTQTTAVEFAARTGEGISRQLAQPGDALGRRRVG